MSKKTPKRRGPKPAARTRATAAPATPSSLGRRTQTRTLAVIAGVVVVAIVLGGIATMALLVQGGPTTAATRSPSAAALAPSTPASAAVSASPSTPPGGPVAEAMVKLLHHEPFSGHVDETTAARTVQGTVAVNALATAVGDVSARDVDLHVTAAGGGTTVDQDVVAVGDTVWIRPKGGSWQPKPRAEEQSAIDGLRTTIALVDDPKLLVDLGPDTVDGRQVHHLAAATSIDYASPDGDGTYDNYDVWATAEGVPVLARLSYTVGEGESAHLGSVTVRYSNVGGAIQIRPPAGAPTPKP